MFITNKIFIVHPKLSATGYTKEVGIQKKTRLFVRGVYIGLAIVCSLGTAQAQNAVTENKYQTIYGIASQESTLDSTGVEGDKDKNGSIYEEHRDLTGSFVEKGFYDKSIQIPGTPISFLIGGYVKLDMILDLDPIGNLDEFETKTIPIEGTPEAALDGGINMHVKQSRLNFDFRSETDRGLFRAFVEFDLFDDDKTLRVRHAYGVLGHLLAGQTWSTFMDISAQPATIDFEASDPFIFVRQPLIRWEAPIGEYWRWGVALENPTAQITVLDDPDGQVRGIVPDFVARTRFEQNGNHIQLAGVLRQLRFDRPTPEEDATAIGWGLNLTGRWTTFGKDNVRGQIAVGSGISRYIKGISKTDNDAILTADGDLISIPSLNYTLAYLHFWSPTIRSNITFGIADLDNQQAQVDDTISKLWSWHVNLVWSPWHLMNIGIEFMQGERINKDGAKGTANRIQLAAQFKFN
jgi:hypothetical protein